MVPWADAVGIFLLEEPMSAQTTPSDLIARLGGGTAEDRWSAYAELEDLPEDQAAALATDALSNADWRVRRAGAIYADHHPVPSLMERLELALHDPKAKVRMFAVHSLACEPCKPGGNPVDAVPLLIRALKEDKAPRVRKTAAIMLWQQPPERRIVRALRVAAERETHEKTRRWMRYVLRMQEAALMPDGGALKGADHG
jgi:HEAT repeat protein